MSIDIKFTQKVGLSKKPGALVIVNFYILIKACIDLM